MTFLAVGDCGVGIAAGGDGARQLAVARTMQRLADAVDVRFVVTLGDTIYHGPAGPTDHSGAHDDDWWLTYFQPYRYLLDHLAFYPTAGNHDGADEEAADDRAQLEDNLYLTTRFAPREEAGRASLGPGLFYKLQLGALLDLVCVDTTWGAERGAHWFDEPHHRAWLEEAFASSSADVVWQVPFCHHPAWSAGPHHVDMAAQIDRLVPLYRRAGTRLAAPRPRAQLPARAGRRPRLHRVRRRREAGPARPRAARVRRARCRGRPSRTACSCRSRRRP